MPMPGPGQTVHLMGWRDVLRYRWKMQREEGRNAAELELYTTDDLRRLYQGTDSDLIRLRDGIVSRTQIVAEIRWRVFWDRFGYALPMWATLFALVVAIAALFKG